MSNPSAISSPSSPGWSRWIERLRSATAGRFTIIRELGRGGFAAVFLAQQLQPNRRVAIKLLLPAHLDSQWALEHFRGESQKIAEWRHQSVVTIYEVHEVNDLFFFVMSYVEGGSLHELIHMLGPLSVPVTKSVLAQTGSALQYAHRQGVTHRDIKPHNVLVDVDGGAVVTDFGISKQSGGTSHTVTGMIFGTAPYMAPEQCESGTTSFASDQYALGIVAYEMMTGAPPFTGPATSVLLAHLQKEVPLLRTVRPDCPPELEAAVARMLAKNPADRFPSVAEAMQAAGAIELPEFDPQRRAFAQAARDVAARSQAHVLELVSIPPTMEVGDRIPLQASAKTMAGDPVADTDIHWSIDNGAVAQLDEQKGELTALKPGFTTLFLRSSGGAEQQVRVDIKAPQAATIEVTGPKTALRIGERTRLTASAKSKHGLPVTGPTIWVSEDPRLATVTAEGVLQALSPGRTRIRAQVDSVTSEFWVDVATAEVAEVRVMGAPTSLSVGDRRQLSAVVMDDSDQVLTDRNVQWTSSDRQIAMVSPTGMITASASGNVTITAACDSHFATVRIMVETPQAVIVEMTNPPESLRMGDSVRLRAMARDAQGHTVDRAITWLSDDPAVARVAADGTLTAVAPGNAIVSASIDGVATAVAVDVTRRISVTTPTPVQGSATNLFNAPPIAAPVAASVTQQKVAPVRATPSNAAPVNREIANAAPNASSNVSQPPKGNLARYLALGAVAVAAAATLVIMKMGGGDDDTTTPTTATAPTTKTPDSVARGNSATPPSTPAPKPRDNGGAAYAIDILPPTAPLFVGDSIHLRVVGNSAAVARLRWTSSAGGIASVSADGVVRGIKPGRASIAGSVDDLHDMVPIEVRAKPIVAATPPASASATKANDPPVSAAQQKTIEPPPSTTAVTPPVYTAPPAAASVPVAAPVNTKEENERHVRTLVNDYASALSARKLDDAVKLFPRMDAATRQRWTTFFGTGTEMHVQYDVVSMSLVRDNGTASVAGTHEFLMPGRKGKCQMQVTLQLRLEQTANVWHIVGLDQKDGTARNCK